MTVKTSERERERFGERHRAGEGYEAIAAAHGVSKECVRYWCRRQRDGLSCQSRWHRRKAGALVQFEPIVRYGILRLRLAHPRWGAGVIHVHLGKRPSLVGKRLPSVASIGRYLHQWPRFRRRRKKSPAPSSRPPAATQVHECWQIDFKDSIALHDGTRVNLHSVRDPVAAACITAQVTPAGRVGEPHKRVTITQLQTTLRRAFDRWQTLPQRIQTDGEPVFLGSAKDDFPSRFTLWLLGLGIKHQVTRPGRPTDNAEVERSHQLLCNYALYGQEHRDCAALQAYLDQALEELLWQIPSRSPRCQGVPPAHASPALFHLPQPWHASLEVEHFDLDRVDAYLATFTWQRRVGKTGQICIGGHHHYYAVGRAFAQQTISVRFDPTDRHFVFYLADDKATPICRLPARYLSVAELCASSHLPNTQQLAFSFPQGVNC
jgi:transposase InsO family protein